MQGDSVNAFISLVKTVIAEFILNVYENHQAARHTDDQAYNVDDREELVLQNVPDSYSKVVFNTAPDVIFSSLFCHHFTEEQLVFMLQWMNKNSKAGFFINDLQRSAVAYYLIKWLTAIFSKSYMVKNDGPISVSRSFTKKDWQLLFAKAGISNYSVKLKWAFRYLVVCKK